MTIFQSVSPGAPVNVDYPKKLFATACYIKQHVCVYLQPFSR